MDQVDFLNNFMFGNSIYFFAFLAEVISHTIMAKKANKKFGLF